MSFWIKFMGSDSSSATEQFYIHSGAWTTSGWGFGMKAQTNTLYFRWTTRMRYWGDVSFSAPSIDVWHHFGITWGWWNGLTVYVVSCYCAMVHDEFPFLSVLCVCIEYS